MSNGEKGNFAWERHFSFGFLLARTIRSVSCHNFLDSQRSDSSTRSPTDQQIRSGTVKNLWIKKILEQILDFYLILNRSKIDFWCEHEWFCSLSMLCLFDPSDWSYHFILDPVKNGRLSSPLRPLVPSFNEHGHPRLTSPLRSPTSRASAPTITTNGNHLSNGTVNGLPRSREVSRERLDYTDLQGNFNHFIFSTIILIF